MMKSINVISNSNVKIRNKYDMMNDILFCCSKRWIGRTNIRRYCNLTTKNTYLIDVLKDFKMLNERHHVNFKGGRQYMISNKGLKFCKAYAQFVGLMRFENDC